MVRKIKQNLICIVEDVKTRNEAEKFKNLILYVRRDNLPLLKDDEFYQRDLLEFQVYDLERHNLGFVTSFNDFGGGLLVEVEKNKKRFYLPIGKPFLKDINYKDKEVILNIDLGFIES